MVWLVIILVILIFTSLILALKFLVFTKPVATDVMNDPLLDNKHDKKVVGLLTLRVIFSIILLLLCYLYLSSL